MLDSNGCAQDNDVALGVDAAFLLAPAAGALWALLKFAAVMLFLLLTGWWLPYFLKSDEPIHPSDEQTHSL